MADELKSRVANQIRNTSELSEPQKITAVLACFGSIEAALNLA